MNIRFGSIICLIFSILAFSAHGINIENFSIIQKLGEYIDYMFGEDPIRYVRYFYVYVICRLLKGKFANQTLPLSPKQLWLYLNGSLIIYHAELAANLPLEEEKGTLQGFSLESALDYSYWLYWWAMASHSHYAHAFIHALPGTILFENYDLYGLVSGFLSNDQRTRSIY
jgi:hypothetical protein